METHHVTSGAASETSVKETYLDLSSWGLLTCLRWAKDPISRGFFEEWAVHTPAKFNELKLQ